MPTKTERPVPLNVRLSVETLREVRQLAQERETSVAAIARRALAQYVEQEKR